MPTSGMAGLGCLADKRMPSSHATGLSTILGARAWAGPREGFSLKAVSGKQPCDIPSKGDSVDAATRQGTSPAAEWAYLDAGMPFAALPGRRAVRGLRGRVPLAPTEHRGKQ